MEATNAISGQKHVFSGVDRVKIVQRYTICQELQNSQSSESLMSHAIPVRPWQILATDIFTDIFTGQLVREQDHE